MTITHRLFFAALPPPEERQAMTAVRDGVRGGNPVADDRLHVTMWITDDWPARPLAGADALLAAAEAAKLPTFSVELDRLVFAPESALLKPTRRVAAIRRVQRQLARALAPLRPSIRRGWHFNPHATLRHGPQTASEHPISPIRWRATELVLIHSLVGNTLHVPLGRVTLDETATPFPDLFGNPEH